MHLLAKHQSFNLVVLCIFLVVCNLVGCSTKTVDDKLYLEKMEHDNSDERVYQINEDFDYSQIVFRLYFTEDSNMWELVETYELNKSEINTFTVGYNYWNSNSRRFSDSQFYLIYGDTENTGIVNKVARGQFTYYVDATTGEIIGGSTSDEIYWENFHFNENKI